MENNALASLDKAVYMLAEAETLMDVKHIVDISKAAVEYAKSAKRGREAENRAKTIQLLASRKAGEFLAQLKTNQGGATKYGSSNNGQTSEYTEAIQEAGITRQDANRFKALTEVSEETIQEYIHECNEKNERITFSGAEALAKPVKEQRKKKRKKDRADTAKRAEAVPFSERWSVHRADVQEWGAPRQYDFIITDPPYPKEYLHLYEVLAYRAAKWLKPGGLLVAMCGQSYLDEIYCMMSKHIQYYWTAAYLTPGQPTPLRQVNVNSTWKPLLIFSNGEYKGKIFGDVFKSDGNDKSMHKWGQSESGMFDIVSKMCLPGQYVLDPFCGAGTTGIAALRHGCLFDGIDIDEQNVNISRARLDDAQI